MALDAGLEAGLENGDRIVREDGQPYLGAGTYYRALDKRFTFRIIWHLTGQSDEHEPGKLVTD